MLLLLLLVVISLVCSFFFYCQALKNGLGTKRWATAGLVFGPFTWPMFAQNKRFRLYQRFGFQCLLLRA